VQSASDPRSVRKIIPENKTETVREEFSAFSKRKNLHQSCDDSGVIWGSFVEEFEGYLRMDPPIAVG